MILFSSRLIYNISDFLVENGPIKIMLFGLVRSFFQPANRNLVSLPSLLSLSSQTSLHLPGREYKKNKNRNFDRFVPFFSNMIFSTYHPVLYYRYICLGSENILIQNRSFCYLSAIEAGRVNDLKVSCKEKKVGFDSHQRSMITAGAEDTGFQTIYAIAV